MGGAIGSKGRALLEDAIRAVPEDRIMVRRAKPVSGPARILSNTTLTSLD